MKTTANQITQWMAHPVTDNLLKILEDHIKKDKDLINTIIMNTNSIDIDKTTPYLIQLKGQIHTLERVLNIKEFLLTNEEEDDSL